MRILLALFLVVAGAVSAVAAIAVHGLWWGIALACAAVLAALLSLEPGWTTRLAFAAGFGLVVLRLSVSRPEGDFVLAGNAQGYLVLGLTLLVLVVAIATLPRRRHARDRGVGARPRMSRDEH